MNFPWRRDRDPKPDRDDRRDDRRQDRLDKIKAKTEKRRQTKFIIFGLLGIVLILFIWFKVMP